MKASTIFLLALFAITPSLEGCAFIRRDRCYLHNYRYEAMKELFLQTGSYQRVAQAMDDEGWARCEVNQFRQQLRKDLELHGEDYDTLFRDLEPDRREVEFYTGHVPYPTAGGGR